MLMQRPSHKTQKVTGSRVKADKLRMKSGEPTLVLSKEKGKIGTGEAYMMKGGEKLGLGPIWRSYDVSQESCQSVEDAPSTPSSLQQHIQGEHPPFSFTHLTPQVPCMWCSCILKC